MKTVPPLESPSRSAPRLVCRIVRSWCALFGAGQARHVAACADCQVYFRTGAALELALRAEAREIARPGPVDDGFERRLLQAIRTERRPAPPDRGAAWKMAWPIGGIASAAAVAALVVGLNFERGPAGPDGLAASNPATDAAVMVDVVESISDRLVNTVIPSAGQLVATNPLQQEIGSVYSDMQSALSFLALNFLPPGSLETTKTPTRPI